MKDFSCDYERYVGKIKKLNIFELNDIIMIMKISEEVMIKYFKFINERL